MQDEERIFKVQADFCGVMCHAKRVQIMSILKDGEKTVSDLAAALEISVPNVSQHLRVMRDQGAVVTRKGGQQVFYSVAHPNFIEACRLIREGLSELLQQRSRAFAGNEAGEASPKTPLSPAGEGNRT